MVILAETSEIKTISTLLPCQTLLKILKIHKMPNIKHHRITSPVTGLAKPPDKFVFLLQLNDDLLTEIEDGTGPAGAENLLVQTALTSLTLSPQSVELLLQS